MRLRPVLALIVPMLLVVTACTTTVAGTPTNGDTVVTKDPDGQGGVDPSFVKNTDGGSIDRLAATVITDVKQYWEETFPSAFDDQWEDLEGGYYSVDTADDDAKAPPCARRASDVEGNAFYCPTEDVIAWDRAALLPVLKEKFGEAAVMFVLAHEMGHAVQRRTGLTLEEQRGNPEKYPTILIEAQADCYAGAFVRWVADGNAGHLKISKDRLDTAMEALVMFRDPVGTEQSDQDAHGDAFDRVSAFQDGYDKGVDLCKDMSVDNRTFTQRGFLSADDQERGGNLEFDSLLTTITPNLDAFYKATVTGLGKEWATPSVKTSDEAPECVDDDQGPIAYCPDSREIDVATGDELPELHTEIGDFATGTILASRFSMATLAALGKPLEGAEAQRAVLCLTGAYTGSLITPQDGFALSPGDLDEAIQVLLRFDYPGRDIAGDAVPTGFDRVSLFRTGALQGVTACKV
ncbi:neutral zinc metallopeptidase [Actinophytocola algeriensis]|uniref:Putative metalloprotease n=1 Tax=Actinophytocola algeriensis TaxID=1768010 RepID=A0A7W7Q7G7_9PSEU|nr:neutral zinc metallopeptidase [Actinophytocola algeriensis]MBB4908089.1 putative metalloprotease [Actinophytocola algeriensis]MBE1480119.1 putative metalloprotease [Actinophytocola algeriensis]